jgi:hypothetical protein
VNTLLLASLAFSTLAVGQETGSRNRSGSPDTPILWRDPGAVESLDFTAGPGGPDGAPLRPFVFSEEQPGGTYPKIRVTDANKRLWSVKWGPEVQAETFATRMLWAVGYIVQPVYFVKEGQIDSVGKLTRAEPHINRDSGNSFRDARFQLWDAKYYPVVLRNWTFDGIERSPQFSGLKVMLMLLSNWDIKDASSSDPDKNTAIMKRELADGTYETHYVVTDWGATMGKWGNVATRSKWDCRGYKNQTPDFVKGVKGEFLRFGFEGKHSDRIREGISVSDVQWLMRYLGRITDQQIHAGLEASGANSEELDCFSRCIRDRIEQLRRVTVSLTQ